jgi:hypothetical protein
VRRLLELFDYPIKQPSWHDQARIIAAKVRQTLEKTGKSYADVNENSPLCGIVTRVLAAIMPIEDRKKQAAVSEALRGRRGKGRNRNKKCP